MRVGLTHVAQGAGGADPLHIRDLGRYNYKGIHEPVQVFQICPMSLVERAFPTLRSEDVLKQTRQTSGNRLLDEASAEAAHDEHGGSGLLDEFATCANPGCGKASRMP